MFSEAVLVLFERFDALGVCTLDESFLVEVVDLSDVDLPVPLAEAVLPLVEAVLPLVEVFPPLEEEFIPLIEDDAALFVEVPALLDEADAVLPLFAPVVLDVVFCVDLVEFVVRDCTMYSSLAKFSSHFA